MNFGQDSSFAGNLTAQNNADSGGVGDFYYTPPTGYKALCTKNLPAPAIADPSEHFNNIVYDDGAGAKTGVGFQPDLVWLKSRGSTYEHELTDSVRGVTKAISSDSNNAETTDSTGLTAFGTDGFTVGADTNYCDTTGDGMVAWCWKAGGTAVSNTDGTITSSVSANTTAGFSIVGYTGNGTLGATVGHGLSSAPEMLIVKNRTTTYDWAVYHKSVASDAETDFLFLNTTAGASDDNGYWNDTAPTNSVFTIGNYGRVNTSTSNYIAYCWHSVEGYSKFGQYTGNGNADGPFIYTGFKPKYFLLKNVTATAGSGGQHWQIADTERHPLNPVDANLLAEATSADSNAWSIKDFLSNGVKIRGSNYAMNQDGDTYIYMAFAERPLKYARAR
jgi:hypothetical protein